MFEIVEVVGRGRLGTQIVVMVNSAIQRRRKLLRFSHMFAPVLETWELDLEPGETFTMTLPSGGTYRAGQLLGFDALLERRPIRSRWRKFEYL